MHRIVLAVNASKFNADLAHVRSVLGARKVLVVHVRLGWVKNSQLQTSKLL